MSRTFNLYLGKGGQLAAMSFFLMRGWNVATPEVDIGDDIFVVDDKKGFFSRIQVKTSKAVERENGYSVQFNLPLDQVATSTDPEIYCNDSYFFYTIIYNLILFSLPLRYESKRGTPKI